MIFATIAYDGDYSRQHNLLCRILTANFDDVQEGLQGDSWISVAQNGQSVNVDSFTSMKHEVKAQEIDRELAINVIDVLRRSFDVTVLDPPEAEAHE